MDANTSGAGRLQPNGPTCAALASHVALLGTGMLAASEETEVRAHLASCAYCRAAEHADALVAGALRRHYGEPSGSMPTSDAWFTAEDMDDMFALVDEEASPRLTMRAAAPAGPAVPVRRTRGDGSGRGGWRAAIGPLVAVLALALVAALLFGRGGQRGTGPAQPAITAAQLQALAGDTVVVSTSNGIYALRASDGTVRWHYTAVPENEAGTPSGALAVAGNTVYAISGIPNPDNPTNPTTALVALRLSDGHLLWSRPLALADYGEAMILANGVLYLSPSVMGTGNGYYDISHITTPPQAGDYTAYAVHASDGRVLWQTSTQHLMNAIPYEFNGLVYLGTTDAIEAVRASDGAVVWSKPMGVGGGVQAGTVSRHVNGMAFVVINSALYLDLKVATTRQLQASANNGAGTQTTTTDQITGSFDAATGADGPQGGFGCSTVTDFAPPVAYPVTASGDVIYQEGQGIWATSVSGPSPCRDPWPLPGWAKFDAAQVGFTLVNGVLYSTDDGVVPLTDRAGSGSYTHAVDASNGHILWSAETDGGTLAQIPSAGGGLVFASAGGTVYALDAGNGAKVWRFIEPKAAMVSAPPVFTTGA